MNQYKNIDLKIDLILLNDETATSFIEKYQENVKALLQRIKILIYLDDFMYIDSGFSIKLLYIETLLKKNNISFDHKSFECEIAEVNNKTLRKIPIRNNAILSYYRDLDSFVSNNDLSFERLVDIYESVKIIDNIYIKNKKVNSGYSKVMMCLTDILYKIELFKIQNNLQILINCKKPCQKVKK